MSKENVADRRMEWAIASDWLRSFLLGFAGEELAFDNILGRSTGSHPPHARDQAEHDRVELFRALLGNLTELLGSQEAAANWLLHDEHFREAVGYVPFDYLEPGDLDALALLHAFAEVEVRCRRSSAGAGERRRIFGNAFPQVDPGRMKPKS